MTDSRRVVRRILDGKMAIDFEIATARRIPTARGQTMVEGMVPTDKKSRF